MTVGFDLLYSESTPGSRAVYSHLLGLKTEDDVDEFRRTVTENLVSFYKSTRPDQPRLLKELEVERDALFAAAKFDEAFDKNIEMLELTSEFTPDVVEFAFKALKTARRYKEAFTFCHVFSDNCFFSSDSMPDTEEFAGEVLSDEENPCKIRHEDVARLQQIADDVAAIDSETPALDRIFKLIELEKAVLNFYHGHSNRQFGRVIRRFSEALGRNDFFSKWQIDFVEMGPYDRLFLDLFMEVLSEINLRDRLFNLTVFNSSWFVSLIENLGNAFMSKMAIAKLLAIGAAAHMFESFCILAWLNANQSPHYSLESSFSWLCNACAVSIVVGYVSCDEENDEYSIPRPFRMMKKYITDKDRQLRRVVGEISEEDWPKYLDILTTISAVNFAEWHPDLTDDDSEVSFEILTSSSLIYGSLDVQYRIAKELTRTPKRCLLAKQHSFFLQFVPRLNFVAENVADLTRSGFLNQVTAIADFCRLIHSDAFERPSDMAAVLEIDELKEALFNDLTTMFSHAWRFDAMNEGVHLLAVRFSVFCNASKVYLDRLIDENTRNFQDSIFRCQMQSHIAPHLMATMLRNANELTRHRWGILYADKFRMICTAYLQAFTQRDWPVEMGINLLLTITSIIGPFPTPLVAFKSIYSSPVAASTALKNFVPKMSPNRARCFNTLPLSAANGDLARAEDVRLFLKKIGSLTAGIGLATMINQTRDMSYNKLLTKDAAARRALVVEMKKVLEDFS